MSLEDFVIVVYGWVDDQLKAWQGPRRLRQRGGGASRCWATALRHRRRLRQRGSAPQLSDSEAITPVVVGEFLRYDTDVRISGIKAQYRNASICGNNRVVFNIAGNKYRLEVEMQYRAGIAWVKFVGACALRYDRCGDRQ
ncbi:MAG: type II toxin-antitoxin system HigB family toxin [Chromatiales bacterium]|nr:type II toxin-antitoxin system HigB family toxin [Chromatiales bacterium]